MSSIGSLSRIPKHVVLRESTGIVGTKGFHHSQLATVSLNRQHPVVH
jgi:hypothetical protein